MKGIPTESMTLLQSWMGRTMKGNVTLKVGKNIVDVKESEFLMEERKNEA